MSYVTRERNSASNCNLEVCLRIAPKFMAQNKASYDEITVVCGSMHLCKAKSSTRGFRRLLRVI